MPANTAVFSILSLAECRTLPHADLGRRVSKLIELDKEDLPLPYCNVIPVSFLQKLFSENNMEVRFRWLLEHLNWQNQESLNTTSSELQTLIKQIHWPHEAQQEFLQKHQAWMSQAYLAIRPSFISDQTHGHFSILHVRGESNVFESILQLWADFYQPEYLTQRWREWQGGIHIPASIVIQKMISSKSSGFATIYYVDRLKAPQISVFSLWGITTQQQRQKNTMDEFVLNLKTNELISQHINIKHHEYVHQLDQLDKKVVSYEQQAIPSLTTVELTELAKLLKKIYLKIGTSTEEALEVEWSYDGKQFFLLHVQSIPTTKISQQLKLPKNLPVAPNTVSAQLTTNLQRPIKVYVINEVAAPTPPYQAKDVAGLCFQSDIWWLSQKTHPKALLEDGQAHYLKHRLVQTLRTYFQHQNGKDFWYQPQSLTTQQLFQLEHGHELEEKEVNPFLGYRGGLRIVHQPDLLDFELDVISDFSKEVDQPIELILPWVRSSGELHLIQKHITHAPVEQYHHLHLWMECSTPENLLNIQQYAATPIAGVVINLDSIYCLLFGLDPDSSNVLKYYSADLVLFQSLLKAVAKRLAFFHKPLILKTKHPTHQIISLLEELGETGIMVPTSELTSTLQFLQAG